MTKLSTACLLALLVAFAFAAAPASAQTRPTAMTCDAYKKELSLAITKIRRTDAVARAAAEEYARQQGPQGVQGQGQGMYDDEVPAMPPTRDYAAMERYRRSAEMACAQRKYPEGINQYIQAFNAINMQPPSHLPQP
jgi:hypothetical protein